MPTCINHPHLETDQSKNAGLCAACARPFCDLCLAEIMGQRLCQQCKLQSVEGVVARPDRHPLAILALIVPIIGYVLCAPLLPITSLIGLLLGSRVLRELREHPNYSGKSAALAAMVISGGTLGTWVVALLATFAFYLSSR